MVLTPLNLLYRRLGRRYLRLVIALQLQLAHVVAFGAIALLTLFVDPSPGEFGRIVAVSQGLVLLENLLVYRSVSRLVRPADPWLRGQRDVGSAIQAWRAVAGLPLDLFRYRRFVLVPLNVAPVSVYITWELGLGWWPDLEILFAGGLVVLLYGAMLRFFAIEIIVRPVVRDIAVSVPPETALPKATIGLKARLMLAVPAINLVSGVVVSGLSSPDRSVNGLGLGVAAAIVVASTISLELALLLAGSILAPLRALRRVTDDVAAGNLSARMPVTRSDEVGQLARSFNEMVGGLEERERLREAFGAYVDPNLAEQVLLKGTALSAEEVEVSVLFLDIRDFTAFAERASAQEVVGLLNGFYERVVPVLERHGGHANKFVGDGLLAVFGAPDRLEDHADRAVAAALDVVGVMREHYGPTLRIGIGINSGPVVAGTVGGGGRFDFTVIGDAVNTASRVEGATRHTDDDVLLTEATRCLLTREHGGFVERPRVELKGKLEQVRLHAPQVLLGAPATRS